MSGSINETLQQFINLSSTVCIPNGYQKLYPSQSVAQPSFVPNNYYKFWQSFANAEETFEYFKELCTIILNRPYNPLFANRLLFSALKDILGLQFITEDLTDDEMRRVLYSKLLANVNNGTIANTIAVYGTLIDPVFIQRIHIGANVSYCAIGGNLPISVSELQVFWNEAPTAGVFVELRWGPVDFFGFAEDPFALGFSSLSGSGSVVRAPHPYFGFAEDPEATGFSTTDDPESGGYFPVLVTPSEGGGHFVTTIFGTQGAN